jgi:hypothetical protein
VPGRNQPRGLGRTPVPSRYRNRVKRLITCLMLPTHTCAINGMKIVGPVDASQFRPKDDTNGIKYRRKLKCSTRDQLRDNPSKSRQTACSVWIGRLRTLPPRSREASPVRRKRSPDDSHEFLDSGKLLEV